MGADGSNDNGRGRPDRPRSSPSGDTITPEEVERRCYNWAEVELEGSTWPDSSWMDECPCEEAFYAGKYIASCERTTTGTLPPSGAAPAPLPPRNGSPGASSPAADSEAAGRVTELEERLSKMESDLHASRAQVSGLAQRERALAPNTVWLPPTHSSG